MDPAIISTSASVADGKPNANTQEVITAPKPSSIGGISGDNGASVGITLVSSTLDSDIPSASVSVADCKSKDNSKEVNTVMEPTNAISDVNMVDSITEAPGIDPSAASVADGKSNANTKEVNLVPEPTSNISSMSCDAANAPIKDDLDYLATKYKTLINQNLAAKSAKSPKRKSSTPMVQEYNKITTVLCGWKSGENRSRECVRYSNKYTLGIGSEQNILCKWNLDKTCGRKCATIEGLFDIIYQCHNELGHPLDPRSHYTNIK